MPIDRELGPTDKACLGWNRTFYFICGTISLKKPPSSVKTDASTNLSTGICAFYSFHLFIYKNWIFSHTSFDWINCPFFLSLLSSVVIAMVTCWSIFSGWGWRHGYKLGLSPLGNKYPHFTFWTYESLDSSLRLMCLSYVAAGMNSGTWRGNETLCFYCWRKWEPAEMWKCYIIELKHTDSSDRWEFPVWIQQIVWRVSNSE